MAQMRGEGVFERADVNKDGTVTREEFIAARAEHFAKLDRNSDGYIDSNDVPERLAKRRAQNGGGGDFLAKQFDADGDGKVSEGRIRERPDAGVRPRRHEQGQRARRARSSPQRKKPPKRPATNGAAASASRSE